MGLLRKPVWSRLCWRELVARAEKQIVTASQRAIFMLCCARAGHGSLYENKYNLLIFKLFSSFVVPARMHEGLYENNYILDVGFQISDLL